MTFRGKVVRGLGVALAATLITVPLTGAAQAETNDPYSAKLWNLQQIHAEDAWPTSTGEGAVVAVVDSGVDLDQPDLAGQLVPGITTVGCPDGETYCSDGDWVGPDGTADAEDVHGTHVSGTIAAVADNGIGVAGVAPHAKIMPVKALDAGTGTTEDIAAGIRWAVDHGADVINMSLGSSPPFDLLTVAGLTPEWQEAVDYATDHGVLVVAAAGNSTWPFCSDPANVGGVLCVTATGPNELPAYYSNLGLNLSNLNNDTVAAPGGNALTCDGDVWSTIPVGAESSCGTEGYDAMAGTSMATPAVSGVAALLYAQCRDRANVLAAIESTATVPLVGRTSPLTLPAYGRGIVDAAKAVTYEGATC